MAEGQEIHEKQEQIDELIDLSYEKKQEGNNDESFELLKKAWALYTEPKEKWTEAYNTAKYIFQDYMELGNYSEAKKWLNQMIKDNNVNHDYHGDLEFEIGKYKYEMGLYEEALEYFMIATKEGGGVRYFEGEDKKYREFYKNPEKIKEGLKRGKNTKEIKEKYNFV
jgi:tetratricopeptide (TPR) repeat protein